MKRYGIKKWSKLFAVMGLTVMLAMTGCGMSGSGSSSSSASSAVSSAAEQSSQETSEPAVKTEKSVSLGKIPKFSGKAYVNIKHGKPDFKKSELKKKSYEHYSELDSLGRCGTAKACIGKDLMPTGKRGSIGSVRPSGWQLIKYDFISGKYLYNRCHLIGYQLTGENANARNLITGTRYLNIDGMLPFENMTADYIKETGNHVLYKVTPIFKGNNLVASGVHMEAESVEDHGDGISFNIYAYNNQPGVKINYATGESKSTGKYSSSGSSSGSSGSSSGGSSSNVASKGTYVICLSTGKFHRPSCSSVKQIKESNKKVYKGKRKNLINEGYVPCKRCNP
jgi:DNA-entry nuclease